MIRMKFFWLAGSVALLGGCADPQVAPPPVEKPQAGETKPTPGPAVASEPSGKKGSITEVDLNRLLQLQDEGRAYVIDVRPGLFYGMGHIPGAVNIPKKSFPRSLLKEVDAIDAAVASGKVLVLYCQNVQCPDGYAVGKGMADLGYSTSLYKGGWEEWKEMGF